MTRAQFADQSTEELVQLFMKMALEQDEAELVDEIDEYNRLYDLMDALEHELKRRASDQRRDLAALLDHKNAQVRLKAALATLAVEPEAAREALQKISDRNEYPQAAEARGMMKALDEGRYVPN